MVHRSHLPRILLFLAVVTVLLVPTLASPVRQVHAASSPDLTVDNIWLEKSSNPGQPVTQVNPGDQFLIVASIKNLGTVTASGYYLDVYYDSDYGRGGPDTMAPGEAQVWYVGALTAQAGTHTTKWVVDPDNQIAESNEANNERDYTFTVGSQTTTTTTTSTESTSSSAFSQTAAPKAITSNGGVSIDTSQSKFGGASAHFDGSGDYLSTPDSADWYFDGDFTIDFWVRFNALPASGTVFRLLGQYVTSSNRVGPYLQNTAGVGYQWGIRVLGGGTDIDNLVTSPGLATNTWYHVAFVRSGNNWMNFQDGTQCGTTLTKSGTYPDLAAALEIGRRGDGTGYMNGWIDELRISKGIARWTSSFTPPTAPYSRDSQTVLLLHMDGTNGSTTFLDDVAVVTTTTTTSTTSSAFSTTNSTTTTTSSSTQSTSTSTSSPVSVPISVTANPSGSIVVDGVTYTSPQTFNWVPASSHAVAANSPVPGASGTQYVWTSWSDGGDQSRTITAPSSPTTYTANYQTQYQVTYSQTGCSLPVSLSATEWVNAGGSAVGTFPPTVTSGDGKTQCVLQSASPAGPINAPTELAGAYTTQYYLTVASSYGSPTGQGWYDAGITATFAVTSPASDGAGTQHVFTGWSSSDTGGYSGADASHSVTVSGPITETASWKTQWQVSFAVNPSGGGTISVNGQPSATAWYDDGTVVSIQANANADYAFSSLSSDTASITFASYSSASTNATIRGTGTVTAGFLLKDTTPPVITPTVTPSANDNGWNNGPVTVTWSVSDPESGIASSNGCTTTTLSTETPLAGTTFTCTATNGAGLPNSASVTVKIDLTAPTLTLPSPTVEATGPSGASVSYDASASDSLSGLNTFSCTAPLGSTFPIAMTTVSCSATDKAGKTASGTFTVTVQDKTAPVVTVPADMTVEATGANGAVVTFTASALDAVDGSLAPTCTPSSGSTFALGSTKVTCSGTDKAGNTGSGSFTASVVDRTPPALTLPSDMTVQATSTSGAVVKFTVSASDLVDDTVAVTCTSASGSTFPLGATTVSCSAKDKADNAASASFKVTVSGSTGVTVTLLSSNGKGLSGAVVQYYSGGWKSFGTTASDGTARMVLSPGTYAFQITYAGASQQKTQNVGANPNVVFQTTLVTVKLLSSTNNELSGAAQYYPGGGWKTFGSGTTTTSMELLPVTYNFQVSWAGASQQMIQNVATTPSVVFKTILVTVKIQSSTNTELSGAAQYYPGGGWKTFGSGTTTTSMELLPVTYNFQVSWAGASQQMIQNVGTNANVVFKTVQVHSDSGKCTSYNAGGWRTFTQDMQLLPGAYTFRFSDGTVNTSYTLVAGAVKHIH